MIVLVTGADGNVGKRLVQAMRDEGHEAIGTDIGTVDITNYDAVMTQVLELSPSLIIHCAALTNVDLCAQQPELALKVNAVGTHNIALAASQIGAQLCYISTNEVFDGQRGTPYLEYDAPHPINPYGYSKWVGEQIVRELLPAHFIVRISWLFAHGGVNFLQKIVQRAASGQPLTVVTNEVACPTYAEDLVEALVALIARPRYGTYHLTNEGHTSRYDFARYILDSYGYADVPITRVIGAQFPRPSHPPVYSALTNFMAAQMGIRLRPWREAVSAFIEREKANEPH